MNTCSIAHGMIQKQEQKDGTYVFECMFCQLRIVIDPQTINAKDQSELNRKMEIQANAFFQNNR